jgi:drug/metabolite transporter (DMT)-like permease
MTAGPAGRLQVWAALGAVYVIWGSTYLGILLAIRTIPVFLMGGIRFTLAGLLLFAVTYRRGARATDPLGWRQWVAAGVVGMLLLFGGNMGVSWAETRVPSGITSLVIATVPLWLALLDRIFWGGRLGRISTIGLVVGLAGAVLLADPTGSGHIDVTGFVVLVLGAVAWAVGSLWSRKAPLPRRPLVAASMEMIVAGVVIGLVGIAAGEPSHMHHISTQSIVALVYLIAVGSLVGYTAYVWLLRAAPVSLVATYAYVNPVVAVFLGWAIENEPITIRTVVAGAMILVAVALIVGTQPTEAEAAAPVPAAAGAREEVARLAE